MPNTLRSGAVPHCPSKTRAYAGSNIKITLEYDGKNYAGWQVQDNTQKTIQKVVEGALKKLFGKKVKTLVSGRTDAGVHAWGQVVNFQTDSSIPLRRLVPALNANLPEDVAVVSAEKVRPDFHSRFSARSKIYRYLILNSSQRIAILRDFVYVYPFALNVAAMRQEAKALVGRHDFKAFCASGSPVKDTKRNIFRIKIIQQPRCLLPAGKPVIAIEVEAEGFLYNMVRSIVGTLLEIGRGKLKKGSLKRILLSKDRRLVGPTVPAHGLFLVKVSY